MNKSQLIKNIAASANLTQAQDCCITSIETSIIDELANGGEVVSLTGFGTF